MKNGVAKAMGKVSLQLPYLMLVVCVFLIATGWTDIDWMIVSYKYRMWNGSDGIWEFSPVLRMEWWSAYMFTLLRLVVGSWLLGYVMCWLQKER